MNIRSKSKINRIFLASVIILAVFGFVMFLSASLGLLTQNGASFNTVAMKQSISLILGLVLFIFLSRIKYTFFRSTAFFILLFAIGLNLLLFIPQISIFHGGASRWLSFGFFSFQPSEFLKIAFIIYAAAWIQHVRDNIRNVGSGLIPYLILMVILSILLLSQSDTDTLVIIAFTGLIMFFIAGMPIRHIIFLGIILSTIVGGVIIIRPYARERVLTFINRGIDEQGAGYQINQSLIAIGSGQLTGRGFGQSVQKFGYLPQPTDDSIFAVGAEEFGFIGSSLLIALYLLFAISSFKIGTGAPDKFGGLVAIGISILIITESFLNMAAMLGLIPLFGVPLLFVSHGGTALIITLAAAGIVANISRYSR